ncbi:MAG TPA: ornithine cyclodeaminase family protein [Alphaproteobacteria bacterium]|jgi:ornithine cyclodeaminase
MSTPEIVIPETFLWLTEADVCSLIDLKDSITALEKGLVMEATGEAINMTKTQTVWKSGSLNVTGAQFTGAGLVGAKVWSNANLGAAPIIVMHGSEDGQIRAIVEAFALGQMRTAALSAVATKWLSQENAEEMTIIGSGHQALPQVSAVRSVRPIKRVRVWSRTPANRAAFVEDIRKTWPELKVEDCATVEAAVKDSPIITTFTRAKDPYIFADMLAKGAHINAGGAIIPSNKEIDTGVFKRCDKIICDNLAQVQKGSKELIDFVAAGGSWDQIKPLSELVKDQKPRPAGADLTIYKFMGMGLADMASAVEVYQRAVAKKVGTDYPHPQRSQPKLL